MNAPWREVPERLWSLWEMVENFRINAVRRLHVELDTFISLGDHNQKVVEANGGYKSSRILNDAKHSESLEKVILEVDSFVTSAGAMLAQMNCVHIDRAIEALGWWLKRDQKEWAELKWRAISLRDAIDNELKQYLYYQYPKIKAEKLQAFSEDWKSVSSAFPSSNPDAFNATDCFAMGHNTAAVFHCMRVLECGLRCLAVDLGLNFDVQNWHNIIEQIESKINEQRKALPRGDQRAQRLQFLSEAAKEFFYFKDGWRNHVSHNRGAYDEHQAVSILEHTKAFMSHLASVLSE